MAERNKLMRALGCHYSGNSGRTEHVTFLCIALDDEIESFLSHDNPALGNGFTLSCGVSYTSTIRASPRAPRCESFSGLICFLLCCAQMLSRLADEGARCRLDIMLPHETFSYQKGGNSMVGETFNVRAREDPALADDDVAGWDQSGEPDAGIERGRKALEIAVVDSNKLGVQAQRAFKLMLVVDFEEHVHAQSFGALLEILRQLVVHRGKDNKDAIGTPRARLDNLINVIHEVLAQNR